MAPQSIIFYHYYLDPFASKYPEWPVTPEPFREYFFQIKEVIHPKTHEKMTDRSLLNAYRALKALSIWAWREYDLPDFFSRAARRRVQPPTSASSKKQGPRFLTDDEARRLVNAADTFLDKTIIRTLLFTGIRIGEMCSLKAENIYEDYIEVYGKTGQNRVNITPDLHNDLKMLSEDSGAVFRDCTGKPMKVCAAGKRVRVCMLRAGITGKKLGPHTLRHTFGYMFQRDCGDLKALQTILGHTQIATTSIYSHLTDKDVQQKYLQFGPHTLFEKSEVKNGQPVPQG